MTVSAERPAQARAARARVPDFFIVGQPKSGTTALYEMLRPHPQIYMPDCKELWFFASELLVRTPRRPEGTPRTLEEYTSQFSAATDEQIAGEASPQYLWSRTAAAAIAAVQPQARIIAIMREPASLLRSLHMQHVQAYVETETDFRRAIELEGPRSEGKQVPPYSYWPLALRYSDNVRYVEQLRRYRELFGPERMLVLIYDDFRADNEAIVRQVLRFLEVDEDFPVRRREANPTIQVRSPRMYDLMRALRVARGPTSLAIKRALITVAPHKLRVSLVRAVERRAFSRDVAPPDEDFMNELRRRFRGEVESLSEYLDRDLLALWGYEHLE